MEPRPNPVAPWCAKAQLCSSCSPSRTQREREDGVSSGPGVPVRAGVKSWLRQPGENGSYTVNGVELAPTVFQAALRGTRDKKKCRSPVSGSNNIVQLMWARVRRGTR